MKSYKESFDDELRQFKIRIEKRAKEKIAEALAQEEAEREAERQARLGPGGLDPQEVFEELPEVCQFFNLNIFKSFTLRLIFRNYKNALTKETFQCCKRR